jgi:hypothetical protein
MSTLRCIVVALVAFAAVSARPVSAQPAPPDVNDPEFKCMLSSSKAIGKFWMAKTKCVVKCFAKFWDGDVPETDCMAPYGGLTAVCIRDTVLFTKGAEDKMILAVRKACDPTFKAGTDCPECYSGSNCSDTGFAGDRTAEVENMVDSFVPGWFCERAGAFYPLEMRCQTTTAKRSAKYVAAATKCYDKCHYLARKGLISFGDCAPPATDPTTQACLAKAAATAAYYIHHDCDPPPASPDNCGGTYPSGEEWVNLARVALEGLVPGTYCAD